LAESIYVRIPTLTIVVTVTPAGREATITLDGKALPPRIADVPYRLDPGPHRLTGQVGNGPMAIAEFDLVEGEKRAVALEVTAPPPERQAAPLEEPKSWPTAAPKKGSSVLLWGGLVTAAIGTVVGTATGVAALDKASTKSCRDTFCTPEGRSDISAGRTFATISTIAFGVAIVGVGVAVYALISKGSTTSSSASRIPEWLGIDGAWPRGAY
jgi:hypothetical protein